MTPTTFRAIHEASGMTSAQLARFLRLEDARSVRRYRSGETAVSGPVSFLMELLRDEVLVLEDRVVWALDVYGEAQMYHSTNPHQEDRA